MESFDRLKKSLKQIPGIGEKNSERIAFFLMTKGRETAQDISYSITGALNDLCVCSVCGGLSDSDPCHICTNSKRSNKALMIVEKQRDVFIFERIGRYNGKYHVLGGLLSPLDGIGPDQLSIESLVKRAKKESVSEIILALSPTTEGEATMMYISQIFDNTDIKITSIARGVPFGSDFEYIDEMTLGRSIDRRQKFEN